MEFSSKPDGRSPRLPCTLCRRGDRGWRVQVTRLLYGVKALLDFSPVHHVPPGTDVLNAPVLILQVIGVLPDVNSQDGGFAFHDRAVLVGGGGDVKLASVDNKPCPS